MLHCRLHEMFTIDLFEEFRQTYVWFSHYPDQQIIAFGSRGYIFRIVSYDWTHYSWKTLSFQHQNYRLLGFTPILLYQNQLLLQEFGTNRFCRIESSFQQIEIVPTDLTFALTFLERITNRNGWDEDFAYEFYLQKSAQICVVIWKNYETNETTKFNIPFQAKKKKIDLILGGQGSFALIERPSQGLIFSKKHVCKNLESLNR